MDHGSRVLLAAVGAAVALAAAYAWATRYFRMAVRTRNAFAAVRTLASPLVGKPAPGFSLPLAGYGADRRAGGGAGRLSPHGGGAGSLSRYRGKAVLLTFWSSF